MKLLTANKMRALDDATIHELGLPSIVLMERAALRCTFEIICAHTTPKTAVALIGPGNNGGDGSAIARQLATKGWNVSLICTHARQRLKGDARKNYDLAVTHNLHIVHMPDPSISSLLASADIWIDALLGTGTTSAPRGAIEELIRSANEIKKKHSPWILAVDQPSGVNADTGQTAGVVLGADQTVTMAYPKWGHVLSPGSDHCGNVVRADIGIPPWLDCPEKDAATLIEPKEALALRWKVAKSDHKGTNGHLLVIAGNSQTPGAGALACRAALATGAGLVTLASTQNVIQNCIQGSPEIMGMKLITEASFREIEEQLNLDRFDCFLFGPGKGTDRKSAFTLFKIAEKLNGRPLIIDADGLTILSHLSEHNKDQELPTWNPTGPVIFTPHPRELANLLGKTTENVTENLPIAARQCLKNYKQNEELIIVAKTSGAVIVGEKTSFIPGGDPGMATAGSGDVLAGIIAACAMKLSPENAAIVGTSLHADCGWKAAQKHGSYGLRATHIIEALSLPTFTRKPFIQR